jgi:SAM-dependent methyltransferase
MPMAIEEVKKAFSDKEIGFAYSNTIHCTEHFNQIEKFSDVFGWKYRDIDYNGHKIHEHISFEPGPDSVSKIWFAPNHLRAFTKEVYNQVGGYDIGMRILDDLDLMCRMYKTTKFKHIDKGLYIYRVHGNNTWIRYNKEIQDNVYRIYDKYIHDLVLAWADKEGLRKIELGGRFNPSIGYETVDLTDCDICCDLNEQWPFEDNSVGVIKAYDIFEHLKDSVYTMKELYRVLVPGGYAFIKVPSTDGRGAFQDPTHKSYWNENSFLYYTNQHWAKYIDSPVRFQSMRSYTTPKDENQVCWVVAHLVSLKDGYRPPGLIKI